MKSPILISLLLMWLSFNIFSCSKDDDSPQPPVISTPTELTAALNDLYHQKDAPGFAVSIVKNDAIVYQQAFGKADVDQDQAYTNQTIQPIGSISKTFIGAAIVKAIEQGHFTLDTDINDILPVQLINPKMPEATIRVRDLVTHTSGLIDEQEAYIQSYYILPGEDLSTSGSQLLQGGFGTQQRESIPLEEYLAEYYLEDGDWYSLDNFIAAEPGTTYAYSNIAASLAAYLVEAATGMPFDQYVKAHILQPLGMNNTGYDQTKLDADKLATLYWDRETPLPAYANDSYPDGSIFTSNEDLSKYLLDMMRGARGESTTLFSKESYELLFQAQLPAGVIHPLIGDNQGVFWVLEDGEIKHDGSDPGTTCNLQFTASGDAGYLLLTNMDASTDDHEQAYFDLAIEVHQAIVAFLSEN